MPSSAFVVYFFFSPVCVRVSSFYFYFFLVIFCYYFLFLFGSLVFRFLLYLCMYRVPALCEVFSLHLSVFESPRFFVFLAI